MAGNEPQFTAEKAGIKSAEISLESVEQLFSVVDVYNQEHSPQAITRKTITAAAKATATPSDINPDIAHLLDEFTAGSDKSISLTIEERIKKIDAGEEIHHKDQREIDALFNSITTQKTDQIYSFNLISDRYERLLKQLGLSIETIHNERFSVTADYNSTIDSETKVGISTNGKIIYYKEDSLESSEIVYDISDQEKFLSFLTKLNPESLEKKLQNGLINLLNSLFYQLNERYSLSKPNQQTLEFLKIINQIISQYERLGIENTSKNLYLYYEDQVTEELKG